MKTLRRLALLLAFLALPAAAEATVIIYKGSARILRGNSLKATSVPTTLFFVIDFNTLEGRFVFAQTVDRVKTVYDDGSRNYGIAEVATKPTPTVFFTSADGAFVGTTNFTFRGFRMSGRKANVFLLPTDPLPATIPKTVTGSYSFSAGNPIVLDGSFRMSVDLKKTQTANGVGNSTAQAAGAIIAEFTGKGFANTTPNP
jgi:hypothetical protein